MRPARRHVQRKVGVRRTGQETDVRPPVTGLEAEVYGDWVELYNGSAVTVALDGTSRAAIDTFRA